MGLSWVFPDMFEMFSDDFGGVMVDTPVLSAGFISAINISNFGTKGGIINAKFGPLEKANHSIAWKKQQEEHQNNFSSEIL